MASAITAVLTAVRNLLIANSALMASVTGIYNSVPQNTAFPYISIINPTETGFNTFGKKGKNITFAIVISTDKPSDKPIADILNAVDNILDETTSLSVTGYNVIKITRDTEETNFEIESDGMARECIARYRIHLQKT
jgi:hypothetical protein